MATTITRQQMIEQSVQDYLRAKLFTDRGLPVAQIAMEDAFRYDQFRDQALDKDYIAVGFNFDDEGTPLELGSDLKQKMHTLEFFVFARSPERGRSLAWNIEAALDDDGRIPLKDYTQSGDPVIDYLIVDGVSQQRQVADNPEPWQEAAWLVTLKLLDEYFAMSV